MDRGWNPFVFHSYIYIYIYVNDMVSFRYHQSMDIKNLDSNFDMYTIRVLFTLCLEQPWYLDHISFDYWVAINVSTIARIYPILYDTTEVGTFTKRFIEILAYGWIYIYVDANHTPKRGGPTMNSYESTCSYWVWGVHLKLRLWITWVRTFEPPPLCMC